jgi:transposase
MSDSMLAIRRSAMRPGIELRQDYDAARLRALAKATHDAGQSRRLLALAEIYDGGTRTKAAQVGGVGLQTVRDWVVRFNAHGPEALIDGKAPGNACKLRACHREALLALVESGPIPAVHGVVRWRLKDLVQWLWDEFRIGVSETTLGRELRTLGYRKLSARPRHHAKSDAAVAVFKKSFPRVWRKSRSTRLMASRSRSGLPMRRASARRTRSPAAGPGVARVPPPRGT